MIWEAKATGKLLTTTLTGATVGSAKRLTLCKTNTEMHLDADAQIGLCNSNTIGVKLKKMSSTVIWGQDPYLMYLEVCHPPPHLVCAPSRSTSLAMPITVTLEIILN